MWLKIDVDKDMDEKSADVQCIQLLMFSVLVGNTSHSVFSPTVGPFFTILRYTLFSVCLRKLFT